MTETYQEALERLTRKVERAEEVVANWRATQEANRRNAEERQRHQEARALLNQAVPNFSAPLRTLKESYDEAVERVRNDTDLTEEAKTRKLQELTTAHRQAVREEVSGVRDRMGSHLSHYRSLAKVNDDPTDEMRYARIEREFMAKVNAGRIPDLQSYWEAIESGDQDLIRVFEVHASRYIEDEGDQQAFNAEVEKQRQYRLTDEQKLARQRLRELQARRDNFELGLRQGAFGAEARQIADVDSIGSRETLRGS
jgi:hypothetical protein